ERAPVDRHYGDRSHRVHLPRGRLAFEDAFVLDPSIRPGFRAPVAHAVVDECTEARTPLHTEWRALGLHKAGWLSPRGPRDWRGHQGIALIGLLAGSAVVGITVMLIVCVRRTSSSTRANPCRKGSVQRRSGLTKTDFAPSPLRHNSHPDGTAMGEVWKRQFPPVCVAWMGSSAMAMVIEARAEVQQARNPGCPTDLLTGGCCTRNRCCSRHNRSRLLSGGPMTPAPFKKSAS